MTSRTRTPQEGEIVILKNRFGNYAALKIIDIKDRTRSDDRDELTFEYVINPNGYTDFSQQKAIVAKWWRRIWPWVKGIPRWIYVLVLFLAALLTCIYLSLWLWTKFSP